MGINLNEEENNFFINKKSIKFLYYPDKLYIIVMDAWEK